MQRIYRILRNNKELGPFGFEELGHQNLLPTDLIWIDGQSSGWKYTSEIPLIRSSISGEPDPVLSNTKAPDLNLAAQAEGNQFKAIQEPEVETEKPTELSEQDLEKKADALYQRVMNYQAGKTVEESKEEIHYSKSLDELKQEYADWLHHNHEGKAGKRSLSTLLPLIIILALSLFGALGWKLLRNKDTNMIASSSTDQNEAYREKPLLPLQTNPPVNHKNIKENSATANNEESKSVDLYIDSIEKVLDASDVKLSSKKASAARLYKAKFTNKNLITQPDPILKIKAVSPASPPLEKLVDMNAHYMYDDKQQLFGIEITLKNNSVQVLKKASVEVFYFKKGNKLFDKETLYFTNINPGTSFTLSTPGNKKAISATFQLQNVIGEH